jgi:hypothetical protein
MSASRKPRSGSGSLRPHCRSLQQRPSAVASLSRSSRPSRPGPGRAATHGVTRYRRGARRIPAIRPDAGRCPIRTSAPGGTWDSRRVGGAARTDPAFIPIQLKQAKHRPDIRLQPLCPNKSNPDGAGFRTHPAESVPLSPQPAATLLPPVRGRNNMDVPLHGFASAATGITQSVIATLPRRLRGILLRPDKDGYETDRSIWNGVVDRRPALIIQAAWRYQGDPHRHPGTQAWRAARRAWRRSQRCP